MALPYNLRPKYFWSLSIFLPDITKFSNLRVSLKLNANWMHFRKILTNANSTSECFWLHCAPKTLKAKSPKIAKNLCFHESASFFQLMIPVSPVIKFSAPFNCLGHWLPIWRPLSDWPGWLAGWSTGAQRRLLDLSRCCSWSTRRSLGASARRRGVRCCVWASNQWSLICVKTGLWSLTDWVLRHSKYVEF